MGRLAMTEHAARLLVRYRLAVVAVLVCAAAAASWTARELPVEFDPEELVAVDAGVAEERARLEEAFGPSPAAAVVVLDARGSAEPVTSDASLMAIHALARELAAVPGVSRVEGLTTSRLPCAMADDVATLDGLEENGAGADRIATIVAAEPEWFPAGLLSLGEPISLRPIGGDGALTATQCAEVRRAVHSLPLVRRRLVSEDERVTVVVALLDTDEPRRSEEIVRQIRARVASASLRGMEASVTGLPAMREEMNRALREDQVQLVALAALGTLLVLIAGMRSRAGVLLPLGAVGIALALTMGLMAASGAALNLLTNMLPPLLLTIGLAEAMHMVLRHQEELRSGRSAVDAAVEVVRTMWLPCFVTTFTTAVGFAALMFAESSALQTFGAIAASASMLGYVVTVSFVPAALPFFRVKRSAERGPDALDRTLVELADRVAARPFLTIALGLALGAGASWMARGVEVETRLLDQFARGTTIAETCATLEAELDGFRTIELGLFAEPGTFQTVRGLGLLEAIATEARHHDDVLRASSVSDVAHEALALLAANPEARTSPFRTDEGAAALVGLLQEEDPVGLGRLVRQDASAARIEIRVRDSGAARTLALIEVLRAAAAREASEHGVAVELRVGGEAYAASRGLERITRSLGGLSAAVVTIFIVMALLFRSVRLGLLAIPPNALPLLVTLAYMTMRGIPLHASTVIVFTVTVGLAVDGSTHVVSRFREELVAGGDRQEILRRTVLGSGRAVLLSSVTLLVGYVVLLTSRFEPVRLFGELSLVAIAGATVSQTLLLPAMLALWGAPRADKRASDA